ncbi:MAG: ribosome recycling factor [Bacteroidota bacterium]
MEEVQLFLDDASEHMEKAIEHLIKVLAKIRAGKATPGMLDTIMVEYYGTQTPLNQMSSITTPDAHSIFIKPWEKNLIHEIERAIMNSDLGFNPQNDGEQVIINVPALTEERRVELVKQVKHEGENSKISIRNSRHDLMHSLKDLKNEGVSEDNIRDGEDLAQKLTDDYNQKIEEIVNHKEEEIMKV